MGRNRTDIEAFVSAFNADPGGRDKLVARLVADEGRLALNLPGRGMARLISDRLREGPFSAFYDFEMILARALHPRCADLKLNIIADITVNGFFDEKYRTYAADAGAALRQGGGIGPLREVLVRMVGREGHRMTVKFCDIVVKWADPSLYRTLRPIEACVMDMKEGRSAGGPPRLGLITALFEEFEAREGKAGARLLLERMDWDDDLREFAPGLQEALYAGDGEGPAAGDGAESGVLSDWQHDDEGGLMDRAGGGEARSEDTTRAGTRGGALAAPRTRTEIYAQILMKEYLNAKDPGDEEGIRRLIDRIEAKNGKAFGRERAREIVDGVLAYWSADPSIEGAVRYLLDIIREERSGPPEDGASGKEDALTLPEDTAPRADGEPAAAEGAPVGEGHGVTGETEALTGEIDTEADRGELPAEPGDIVKEDATDALTVPERQGPGDGTLLDELEAEFTGVKRSPGAAGPTAEEEDSFLLDEFTRSGGSEQGSGSGTGQDDEYLIGGTADKSAAPEREEVPEEQAAEEAKPSQETISPVKEEDFTIQDEILFQDETEKRTKTRYQRPRKGTRITKIEISSQDEDK